jgi:hypothetical protein
MELQRGFATCWGMGGNDRPRTADGRPRDGRWTMHTVGQAFEPVGGGQTVNEGGNE